MPIYHIGKQLGPPSQPCANYSPVGLLTEITAVLFKLKSGVTPTQISAFTARAKGMVGQIPGLTKLEVNTPLASTANRGQGFNMGLVAILEKADDVKVYAEHPAHLEYVLWSALAMLLDTDRFW